MSESKLQNKLKSGLLFLDGAMGTQLMARGAKSGQCNEKLNVDSPALVIDVHKDYFASGSDAVLTNTFGGNEITLKRHGCEKDVESFCIAAAENARIAAGTEKIVIGDIGPCGEFLQPLGTLEPKQLRTAFARQAQALADGGVDGFIIETFTAIDEAKVALEAVKSVSDLPVFVSFAYDPAGEDFRTMMGLSVNLAVDDLVQLQPDAIGFNCGTLTMEQYLRLTEKYAKALEGTNILLLAEPNAGKPDLVDGQAVYNLSADEFGDWAVKLRSAGASILGGCCGTSPAHIAALTVKVKSL